MVRLLIMMVVVVVMVLCCDVVSLAARVPSAPPPIGSPVRPLRNLPGAAAFHHLEQVE